MSQLAMTVKPLTSFGLSENEINTDLTQECINLTFWQEKQEVAAQ